MVISLTAPMATPGSGPGDPLFTRLVAQGVADDLDTAVAELNATAQPSPRHDRSFTDEHPPGAVLTFTDPAYRGPAHAVGDPVTAKSSRLESVCGPDRKRANSQAASGDGYQRAGLEPVCDRRKVRRQEGGLLVRREVVCRPEQNHRGPGSAG